MGLTGLIVLVVLILAAAGPAKYLFFSTLMTGRIGLAVRITTINGIESYGTVISMASIGAQ